MQMQNHQAELSSSLQHKQLQVVQAAEQFQPIVSNLEKVGSVLGVYSNIAMHVHHNTTKMVPLHDVQAKPCLISALFDPASELRACCA